MKENYILMVDDDEDDRFLFLEAVKSIGSDVTCRTAEHGGEALKLLRTETTLPRVIFLDINMAEMSGWQCLRQLKEDENLKSIPVIMYSTSVHSREIDLASQFGAQCYCIKPDSLKELEAIVQFVDKNLDGGLKVALDEFPNPLINLKKYLTCFF